MITEADRRRIMASLDKSHNFGEMAGRLALRAVKFIFSKGFLVAVVALLGTL